LYSPNVSAEVNRYAAMMHFSISAKDFLDKLKRSDSTHRKLVTIDTREMNTSNQLNDSLVRQTREGQKQRV
jgi:hypothetical protein